MCRGIPTIRRIAGVATVLVVSILSAAQVQASTAPTGPTFRFSGVSAAGLVQRNGVGLEGLSYTLGGSGGGNAPDLNVGLPNSANAGMAVSSGLYLYEIRSGGFHDAKKMLLLK